jgi:capsular exopolysaccharide synthesis family protein
MFVISRALPATQKSSPNHTKNMLLTFILATAASVGLCFFLDYLDTAIKSETDVKTILGATVLAGVPNAATEMTGTSNPDLIAHEYPKGHAAEAFRSLRTALAFAMPDSPLKSLVVTSTLPSEGKSLMAVNLAIAQAHASRKTLIVDADLRKPRLHRVFAVSPGKGLSNLLAGETTTALDRVVLQTSIENLSFLPSGPLPPNPVEILDSKRFASAVEEMKTKFDTVIFDSPPSLTLVDALVMARFTEGLLLVVRSFSTSKGAARQLVEMVRRANLRLLGVVLNNIDVPGGYYYGGYYRRYQYYYARANAS